MITNPVTSIDFPELDLYRTLRQSTAHWRAGVFIAEGEKAVTMLLQSRLSVVSLLLTEQWLQRMSSYLTHERFRDLVCYIAPDALLGDIVGIDMHQGLMALGRIPENPALENLSGSVEGRHILVALEGIADAENMGSILRNCAAFGVDGVIVGNDSTSPWLRRSVRVSLGTVFGLRIHRAERVLDALALLRRQGAWKIVGTSPRGGMPQILIDDTDAPVRCCLLFGSEATGLTENALALCDGVFSIPMREGVDSLNVATTVGVALYEARRRGLFDEPVR
jgi:tRNA G18 (ribose-2'-O)-methylase SpoU